MFPAYYGWQNKPLGVDVTFLFNDEFTTDDAAPITSPRTAEPGPGTLTFTEGVARFAISGSILDCPTSASTNQRVETTSFDEDTSAGLTFYTRVRIDAGGRFRWGIARNPANLGVDTFHFKNLSTGISVIDKNTETSIVYPTSGFPTAWLDTHVVNRTAGSFFVIGSTLLWVAERTPTTPNFLDWVAVADQTSSDFAMDNVRVSQLTSPWDTDYGIATERLAGARSSGDTFTHEADTLVEFEVDTIPSSGQIEMRFRIQDTSNYWQVTIDSSGNLDLDEVVSGTPTQRGTSAGVIANSDRVMIIADDEEIKVFEANTLRITYSSAANFKTETSGELETEGTGGAVSEIIAWPRTLSGTAKTELDNVANA